MDLMRLRMLRKANPLYGNDWIKITTRRARRRGNDYLVISLARVIRGHA